MSIVHLFHPMRNLKTFQLAVTPVAGDQSLPVNHLRVLQIKMHAPRRIHNVHKQPVYNTDPTLAGQKNFQVTIHLTLQQYSLNVL